MQFLARVPDDVCKVYIPQEHFASEGQNFHRITADDFHWDTPLVPTLRMLCLQAVSAAFDHLQPLNVVLQQDTDDLMEILPADCDLRSTVDTVSDEGYWRRCCMTKWPGIVSDEHEQAPGFWKTTYLTGYLEEHLETAKPATFDEEKTKNLAELLSPFVHKLDLKQLQMVEPSIQNIGSTDDTFKDECVAQKDVPVDHIRLGPILSQLVNLTEMRLVFGVNNLLNGLDWRLFEFSEADCQSICSGLGHLPNIKTLAINRSIFNDRNLNVFLRFVAEKSSIEELDLAHCDISDRGIVAIGLVLMEHASLKVLNLCNNRFGSDGMKGLAFCIQEQPKAPLNVLDLSKNMLSKRSIQFLSSALARCKTKPEELNISYCNIRSSSAVLFSEMLRLNNSLRRLNISGNDFSSAAETVLIDSLLRNVHITDLVFDGCGISKEGGETMLDALKRNRSGKTWKIEGKEIPPLYLSDPEYLVWEFNPNNPDHVPGHYPKRVPEK